jgi:hypothetical protein
MLLVHFQLSLHVGDNVELNGRRLRLGEYDRVNPSGIPSPPFHAAAHQRREVMLLPSTLPLATRTR